MEAPNQDQFLYSPTKYKEMHKSLQMESQATMARKDPESAKPLISRFETDNTVFKYDKQLTTRETAAYGFLLAPIWFSTEVRFSFIKFSFFPV